MKTFSIHAVRNLFAFVIALGLGYIAYTVNPTSITGPKAEAGTDDNISGWAYSQGGGTMLNDPFTGIGWISFNSTNEGSSYTGSSYGVNLSTTKKSTGGTGNFSGYAHSENIGWVSFNRSDTGNPPGGPFNSGSGHIAQVDWSTGKVTGWARALSGCENIPPDPAATPCVTAGSGPGNNSGGWDGWIKLSKDSPDLGVPYGVVFSGNKFSGLAWGGEVVGWIDFGPKVNGIDIGVKLAGQSCTEAQVTSAGTWGTCAPSKTCAVGDEGKTFTNQSGIRTGLCSAADGGGEVVVTCNTATLICPAAGASTGKTKFWQF
ncbi:MAG: hypothetical protein Q7K40_00960 [bacterium]|nr:hypothetical protein [bacterium]